MEHSNHDMIIRRYILHKLEMIMDFSTDTVTWDNAYINIQDQRFFQQMNFDQYEQELFILYDPKTIEVDRIQKILDLKYSPADLDKEVEKIPILQ